MIKKVLLLLLLLGVIGGFVVYKYINKPFVQVDTITPVATLTAGELLQAFQADETKANEAYLDQFVDVTGKVESVSKEDSVWTVILDADDIMATVRCEMDYVQGTQRPDFSPGQQVTLRGMVTGILMDVVLVRCIEIKK
ncbi:MAG: hypothetical protein H6561_06325 [Lewinellaceae bacterium]|nr:hypothetical protein [Lewinellaceae bacterium]HPQ99942.1 hypothetical protein [Saprospiraceae bacterium]HQU54853.1 hypothetical protein [Saprospiraceae bacterium]